MRPTSTFRRLGILSAIIAAALSVNPTRAADAKGNRGQALVDLAARIFTCSTHPCLGDSVKDLRSALRGKIVTDGTFYFSDLSVAYPAIRGTLNGLVEWNFDSGLDTISMKITGFEVAPTVLAAELEEALPGCEMDGDADDLQAGDDEGDDIPENNWSCLATTNGVKDVLVDVYFAPGLVLFELTR